MSDESNPHDDKSTEEKKAADLAANEQASKEAEALAAKEAALEAAKTAAEKSKDLPKADPEGEEEEGKDTSETPLDTEAYGDTGSEVGNSVLKLMQDAGATPDEAKALLFEAVQKNDMSLIDLPALEAKVGKSAATIIVSGSKTYAAEVAEKNSAISKAVFEAAGGEQNWTTIRSWAEDNVSDSDMAGYNDLISKGGPTARYAASELLAKYNADSSNTEITDTPTIVADVDTSSSSEAITAKEYYARLVVAKRTGADEKPIKAARARGRAKGI